MHVYYLTLISKGLTINISRRIASKFTNNACCRHTDVTQHAPHVINQKVCDTHVEAGAPGSL